MSTEPEITVFRTDRPGIRKVLGELEAEIMELIWERPEGQGTTVREVFEVLYERRKMAYTTIMNTMTRMAKKKFLRVEKEDHAYVYYPILDKSAFISRFVEHILEDLLVSFSGATQQGVEKLLASDAASSARHYVEEISRRRAEEEDA